MKELANVECIIFDCDGTLVDSEKLNQQALSETFAHYGVQLNADNHWQHFQGGKMTDILADTRDRYNLPVTVDELEPRYREACQRLYLQGVEPVAGVPELLDKLSTQGYELCIASNAPSNKITELLNLTGLSDYFQGRVFSGFDTNSWKPDPDLLHYAAMLMGVPLEKCVFVDDTVRGVQAGINAHIPTFHLQANPSAQKFEHPDVVALHSMPELLAYLSPSHSQVNTCCEGA